MIDSNCEVWSDVTIIEFNWTISSKVRSEEPVFFFLYLLSALFLLSLKIEHHWLEGSKVLLKDGAFWTAFEKLKETLSSYQISNNSVPHYYLISFTRIESGQGIFRFTGHDSVDE